jgi:hypothetical protein
VSLNANGENTVILQGQCQSVEWLDHKNEKYLRFFLSSRSKKANVSISTWINETVALTVKDLKELDTVSVAAKFRTSKEGNSKLIVTRINPNSGGIDQPVNFIALEGCCETVLQGEGLILVFSNVDRKTGTGYQRRIFCSASDEQLVKGRVTAGVPCVVEGFLKYNKNERCFEIETEHIKNSTAVMVEIEGHPYIQ